MTMIELLQQMPVFLWLCVGLVSLAVGSFLNVVIYRLPLMLQHHWRQECLIYLEQLSADKATTATISLSHPPSTCPHCQQQIKIWQNIPVLSYLFLKGRCGHCQQKISWRYPLVEALCCALSLALAVHFGFSVELLAGLIFCWLLIAMSFIDFDHQLLPDSLSLSLLWLGLLFNLHHLFTDLQSAVIGAVAGYASLWLIMQGHRLLSGKQGMGHGDFKLFAALGAWFGWQLLPAIILIAAVSGLVISVPYLLINRQQTSTPIPFGPYLAIAGMIALFFSAEIGKGYAFFLL